MFFSFRRQTAQRLGQEQRPRDKRNLYLAAVEGAALADSDPDPRKAARDSKDKDRDSRDRDKRIKAQVADCRPSLDLT